MPPKLRRRDNIETDQKGSIPRFHRDKKTPSFVGHLHGGGECGVHSEVFHVRGSFTVRSDHGPLGHCTVRFMWNLLCTVGHRLAVDASGFTVLGFIRLIRAGKNDIYPIPSIWDPRCRYPRWKRLTGRFLRSDSNLSTPT